MKGVLLVNMGSPTSKSEMREFLFNMFSDKAILPFPIIPRKTLAFLISNLRYRGSWAKYELIGGSPLKESMKSINTALSQEIGAEYLVYSAYSYSSPTVEDGISYFHKKGITEIDVITMYPQSSISTTDSVKIDLGKVEKKFPDIKVAIANTFSEQKTFIAYWVELIQESIDKSGYKNPTLLFSAHAIPTYQVDNGDTYVDEINASANTIANEMSLPYRVSFQSKIGRVKWVGPDSKDCLKAMKDDGIDEIILVPISFINENLETLYDQDVEIIPYGKNELGIKNISRAHIPSTHPLLIETFKNLLIDCK